MATQDQAREDKLQGEGSGPTAVRDMDRAQPSSIPARRGSYASGPFSLMRRFSEDMDRLFSGFFGREAFSFGDWSEQLTGPSALGNMSLWPELEVHQAGDKIVIQADVPGLKKEDISVELRQNELCIAGERRNQSERTEGRFYRSERSYGRFCRTIRLPEGAKPDTASATFENGVLKIEIESPNSQSEARKIEVREGNAH